MRLTPWTDIPTEEVQEKVCAGERPLFDVDSSSHPDERLFKHVATNAWVQLPQNRPSFADLSAYLIHNRPDISQPY